MNPSHAYFGGNKPKIADLQAHNVAWLFLVEIWCLWEREKKLKKLWFCFTENKWFNRQHINTSIVLNNRLIWLFVAIELRSFFLFLLGGWWGAHVCVWLCVTGELIIKNIMFYSFFFIDMSFCYYLVCSNKLLRWCKQHRLVILSNKKTGVKQECMCQSVHLFWDFFHAFPLYL